MDCIVDGIRGIYMGQYLGRLLACGGLERGGIEQADIDILLAGPGGPAYDDATDGVVTTWQGANGEFLFADNGDIFIVQGEDDPDYEDKDSLWEDE
jgi:hypothetical protein